ncbi:hypothetical protein [uncultured Microbacterium sp.]|uniref:hypothetical protein n=1 Tax=uncultured Microbacterium sp. TaxID=191216 RepID=UPI0025FF712E|nr:hypothetical protein [uncultured Microbacterium sp.]
MRKRLANFLVLFPGHTAVNVHDITYQDWIALAHETDQHVEQRKSAGRRRR